MAALDIAGVLEILRQAEEGPEIVDGEAGGFEPGRGHGGLRPGAGRHGGRGRAGAGRGRIPQGLRQRIPEKRKRVRAFNRQARTVDHQASVFNSNGRSRNQDYHFPAHAEGFKRKLAKGKTKWKEWSAEAVLRAGFASESASRREASSSIDGAGSDGHHAGDCRCVVAKAISRGQEKGIQEVREKGCSILVRNLMFDESTFDLCIGSPAASSCSVLCSHAQWTYNLLGADSVQDEHIIRSPQVLVPVMNSVTMHEALSQEAGGLNCTCPRADMIATITTCDAHAANLRMLRFWEQQLPRQHLFLPHLCAQHRTGNVIEQLTKLTGTLGGNFSVSKVLSKANLLGSLRRRVSDRVKRDLAILDTVPPPVQQEWREAKEHAKQLVDLCLSFHEEDPPGVGEGSLRKTFRDLVEFFDGPWTGRKGQNFKL